jgi:hypothetical protein
MLRLSRPLHPRRALLLFLALATLLLTLVWSLVPRSGARFDADEGKGKRASGQIDAAVVGAAPGLAQRAASVPPAGFSPQTRLGYTSGDQWEPAIAADRFGHIYMLYPQYLGVPGCAPSDCPSPTMILQVSADRGATWAAPSPIGPSGTSQVDAQIVVDPIDGRTIYAAWLQNDKSDIAFAKSTDFGAHWQIKVADHINAGTDKPILVARGNDVYIAYDHLTGRGVWVSASHDRGATFTAVKIDPPGINLGVSLASGGTIDPFGNIFFSWVGYERHGQAKGPVTSFVSKSTDQGATWTHTVLNVSGSPPDCSAYLCGWAYLSAQIVIASDASGTLYTLWNSAAEDRGPHALFFAKSTNAGATWSVQDNVSLAPARTNHTFPTIVAGAAGDVRIAWMDTRAAGSLWNTYYRSSTNGGATWSAETDISTYVAGYSYITTDGFGFPFGDYFEIDIDDRGTTHAIWGEGLNYDSPGSIWYARGK